MLKAGFKQLKRQSFPQKYKISELLYEKARKFMEQGKFHEATDHFEQSISVFTDLKLPKKWEETTPEDISIAKFSHEETKHIENIRLKQFEALAQCYFILKDQYSCIKICDYWLNLTPKCVYALTLRAKARFLTEIVSEIDCVMAWRDLEFAHSLDPSNQDVNILYENVRMKLKQYEESKSEYNLLQKKQLELIQQYKKQQMQQQMQQQQKQQLSQSQQKLKQQMQQQQQQQQPLQQSQQQFQFNLPEYGSDDESSDFEDDFSSEFMNQFQNPSYDYDQELSYEQDPTKPIPVEVSELGKFIETRGMEMVKIYEQNGQKQEASDLQDKLKKALAAKKQLEKISQLDFNKPKKKLYQLASNFGIDLLDSSVQNEFKKIQQQNLEDIREWLKQNQWNYTDKITQQQQQELARSELAKIQFKKKNKPQARHKNKFNKKCIPKDNSGVTINNNITYNQTFHQCNDINNNQLIKNELIKQHQSSNMNSEDIDEQINCNGLINLAIFILGIIAILSTLYYSFIK